ncbi:MAG TPA: response regulator [Gammaproteobacteria bacterium]|nr:response regulator [Gammaproteobacteria bacterium]
MSRDDSAHQAALPKVLIVDDEQRVLDSMRLLFRHRYDLFLTTDSRAALDILDQHGVDVLVADREMSTVSGLELLAAARRRSPRMIGILLTENSAAPEIASALTEMGVFRVIRKPIAPSQLRTAIELAMRSLDVAEPPPVAVDPMEFLAERILATEPPPELAGLFSDRLASLSPPTSGQVPTGGDAFARSDSRPVGTSDTQAPREPGAADGTGVVVFSDDAAVVDCVRHAAGGRFRVCTASNVVQAVRLLDEWDLGVLVTDVARDCETAQSMTTRLREHRPELVTIIVAESWDASERASLINTGLVFRFLREPVTVGRCAVALQAAVQHLETTRSGTLRRARIDTPASEDSGVFSGVFERLKSVRRLLA